ncbi:Endochitinase EP3, partial [Nosema granulosis]
GSDSKQAASGESKQAAGNSSSQGGGSQKPSDGDSKQAAGTSGGSKSSSGGGGGGAVNITVDQVTEAMSKSNYQPKPEFVEAIVKVTNEEFKTIEEAAMFLAQTGHESGGFQYIEEIDCAGSTKCAGQYGGSEGAPGKSYHGRGFIQLSWPANYKEAGEALGMGDELFQNPEKVAEDPELGAKVSVWFWQKKVATAPGVSDNQFGATTKAINGALECTGSNLEKSKNRYKIYKDLAEILNISKLADEGGCY